MGVVYPPLETLMQKSQPPTEGELDLLKAFQDYLPKDCEIFFQPYLNGNRPDLVILRKGYRAHIVEVKDWSLNSYVIEKSGQWSLKKDGTKILSPLSQVQRYKENLYNLHVEGLLEELIKAPKKFGMVTCSVYFHCETTSHVISTIKGDNFNPLEDPDKEKVFIELYGRELLEKEQVYRFINLSKLCKKSPYFTDNIYDSMRRIMNPPFHYLEEGVEINYTPQQEKLTLSRGKARQKIKGVAGSGKTLVLARRAVNAYRRTGKTVLILTYNITLINYIHDLINAVREGFPWAAFEIINYHEFFNSKANKHNFSATNLEDYDNTEYYDPVNSKLEKYQTILIDEGQDFRESWHRIIQKHFLADDGELVVFADEKQNIYNNELDTDKKVKVPGIPGVWNESMNRPFRYTGRLIAFIKAYQYRAFKAKYVLDEFEVVLQTEADIGESEIQYIALDAEAKASRIVKEIQKYLIKNQIHPSDATVLNSRISLLREIDYLIRQGNEKTITTFETKEVYGILCAKEKDKDTLQAALKTFRRNKKRHFMMKTGTMKLSTVHSFKGWEINSAIVIIEQEDQQKEFETAELIYTGLTRARVNLLIINIGNAKYDQIIRQAL